MAMQRCSECGKRISTKAKACPECGAPVKADNTMRLLGLGAGLIGFLLLATLGLVVLAIAGAPVLWLVNNPLIGSVLVLGGIAYAVRKKRRKLGFGAALLGAILLVPFGVDQQESDGPANYATVQEAVNLRSGPGIDHPVVRVLEAGQRVRIATGSQASEWTAVLDADGQVEGYVSSSLLVFSSR